MSHKTNLEYKMMIRERYDKGETITHIATTMRRSPAWIWKVLRMTGDTRPRGYNLRKVQPEPQS